MRRFAQNVEDFINKELSATTDTDIRHKLLVNCASRMKSNVIRGAAELNGAAKEIAKDVVKAVESHWTTDKGAAMKARCKLSWTRYQRNMQIWCQDWDDEKHKYVDRTLGEGYLEVPFPQMKHGASKNKVKGFHTELNDILGVEIDMCEGAAHSLNTDDDTDTEEANANERTEKVARVRVPAKKQVGPKLLSLMREKRIDQRVPLEVRLIAACCHPVIHSAWLLIVIAITGICHINSFMCLQYNTGATHY